MSVTLAAGHITDEAQAFLLSHSAIIEGSLGLTIIQLPEDAEVCEPGYQGVRNEYAIQWTDEDGNDPEQWIEVELYLDAYETRVSLRRAAAPRVEAEPETSHAARSIDWDKIFE